MFEKILFIDRDGTLIVEPKKNFQIDKIEKLVFEPDVIISLLALKEKGYKLVMVTNQDGLGSESFPLDNFSIPHSFMLNIFESQGIKFDNILICPHKLEDNCNCRKPKINMVSPWLISGVLDKKNSYVIGDRVSDMELAKNMGISGIRYGYKGTNWTSIRYQLIRNNRFSEVHRRTKETNVYIKVNLDNKKDSFIDTKIKFLDHMLEQISVHSGVYLKIIAVGDLYVDDHHTVEDVGIVLGESLLKAIGSKRGIARFGFTLPMDESLASCVLDLSGRPFISFKADFKYQKVGDLSTEMIEHFFKSLSYSIKSTIHLTAKGTNDHHIAESLFKVFGRCLKQAICIEGNLLPTSKGIL